MKQRMNERFDIYKFFICSKCGQSHNLFFKTKDEVCVNCFESESLKNSDSYNSALNQFLFDVKSDFEKIIDDNINKNIIHGYEYSSIFNDTFKSNTGCPISFYKENILNSENIFESNILFLDIDSLHNEEDLKKSFLAFAIRSEIK